MIWSLLAGMIGCRTLQPVVGLPAKFTQSGEHLMIRSDLKLPRTHPLFAELAELRQEIAETLHLPVQEEPVTVYLFADELRYSQYMKSAWPHLPPRRAYFVGTAKELAVYTFWGDKIQEDLRHEYTHGVLHATLKDVPLWIDEGLAEYFEVSQPPNGLNRDYAVRLTSAVENGWRPDLKRLERLVSVDQMQKADYQEAWAWVHYLLHDSDDTKAVLLDYVRDLRTQESPRALSDRLTQAIPNFEERLLSHAASLPRTGVATSAGDALPH